MRDVSHGTEDVTGIDSTFAREPRSRGHHVTRSLRITGGDTVVPPSNASGMEKNARDRLATGTGGIARRVGLRPGSVSRDQGGNGRAADGPGKRHSSRIVARCAAKTVAGRGLWALKPRAERYRPDYATDAKQWRAVRLGHYTESGTIGRDRTAVLQLAGKLVGSPPA